MLFPTADYAVFFLLVFSAAWALRARLTAHSLLLLGASWFFYGFWDWRFLPLLAGISLVAFVVGRGLQLLPKGPARTALLAAGVAVALSTLGFFKYLGFAAAVLLELAGRFGLAPGPASLPEIALPVGISFFVFHAISLMVDAWRGRISVEVTLLDSLLYVAFFPQLVAGPILRASSFLPQLARAPDPDAVDAARALELIVSGLVKKVLVANFLATRLVDPVFESPASHGGLGALLAVYGYAAQIYCDFSGYTDLAIGSALLLGYRFPENFDAPYLATSPQDFWRRWHISLSSWLRDYLFIPLGGSRGSRLRTTVNLLATMVLGGLWHGAAWTFVAWGALHGAALALHRIWAGLALAPVVRLRGWVAWPWIARLLTFHVVCLGWVLFRSPTFDVAREMLAALGRPDAPGAWVSPAVLVAVFVGLASQAVPAEAARLVRNGFARLPLTVQGLALALAVLAIETLGPRGVAPFIYFQF